MLKVNWGLMWSHIVGANPLLLLAALVAYYATFPLRGLRWWYVLRQVGHARSRTAPPRRCCSCRGS